MRKANKEINVPFRTNAPNLIAQQHGDTPSLSRASDVISTSRDAIDATHATSSLSARSSTPGDVSSNASLKRKLEGGTSQSDTKKPNVYKKLSDLQQDAAYNTEMLCRDGVVWIWWFVRQIIIQSTGINFVKDLPYFMALLLAFQRFNLRDRGMDDIPSKPDFLGVVAPGRRRTHYQHCPVPLLCTRSSTPVHPISTNQPPTSTQPSITN
ncbi:hypothetical protein BDQ12DRAFT_727641 [Crucibulum laeve]|uniref:Fungal-type protein kinase domain-containing protein n=1 Tax=Crucibulum laeve TaxID=68775 RepID=A0A5C3LNQ2_9AGAR|nr:hypothetical protein BDQ12DRAFT_727641 [Crucibulum laeve]